MRIALSVFLLSLSFNLLSQTESSDSLTAHSPRKATLLSAVLPGAGQVYNKKVWKVPVVYGGFALAGYFLNENLKRVDLYRSDLKAIQDGDPNTVPQTNFPQGTLNDLLDQYKDWRDLSYISIGAIYALQIIDANVDAHLFDFDVDEDLSLTILPYSDFTTVPAAGIHLCLKF